ncbi:MAG: LysM peptidoglycan-binding domain-containing protein [Gaiellaceae bacterium]
MAITVERVPHRQERAEQVLRYGTRLVAGAAYGAAVAGAVVLFAPLFRSEPARTVTFTPPEPELTTVRRGETLDLVAARNGISVARLLALNPDVQPLGLEPRQKLRVG